MQESVRVALGCAGISVLAPFGAGTPPLSDDVAISCPPRLKHAKENPSASILDGNICPNSRMASLRRGFHKQQSGKFLECTFRCIKKRTAPGIRLHLLPSEIGITPLVQRVSHDVDIAMAAAKMIALL
jgi:hypothetical protein